MEDVCIVCNRAIEWPEEEVVIEGGKGAGITTESSAHSDGSSSVNNNNAPPMTRKSSSSSAKGLQQQHTTSNSSNNGHGNHHHQATQTGKRSHHHGHGHIVVRGHGHHHHAAKVKRNHSSGRLLDHHHHKHHSKSSANLRPLTSNSNSNSSAAIEAAVEDPSTTSNAPDAVTSENLPDWMSIYCSEECRNEDELRSRLSFANLNEERKRSLGSIHGGASPSSSQRPPSASHSRDYPRSNSSLSPTLGPAHSSSAFRRMVEARAAAAAAAAANAASSGGNGNIATMPHASSPWYNESEGSEFDWGHGQQQRNASASASASANGKASIHGKESPAATMATTVSNSSDAYRHRASSSRDGSDIMVTSGSSEGRRFSDASDSSRLSVHHHHHQARHAQQQQQQPSSTRRSSSRNRGSTDSLASIGSSGHYELYSSSSGYAPPPAASTSFGPSSASISSRPELSHRSTSALSSGLRAMTPIHDMGPASPRLMSPGRPGNTNHNQNSSRRSGSSSSVPDVAHQQQHDYVGSSSIAIPDADHHAAAARATAGSSSSPAGAEAGAGAGGSDAMDIPHGMTPSSLNTATSTYIAPSSTRTFRPGSLSRSATGGSFLKPSKSSATLALSSADDVRATMVAERRTSPGRNGSSSPARRPPNALPRSHSHHHHPHAHSHRNGHHTTSSSSIPYLSCSPSSPGSGSMTSARSNVSTDPSSSSVRGEGEYCDEDEVSDDGEYRPLPRKHDERDSIASLSNYALFHQRTPSTPSLPSLLHQTSYGRSPPSNSSFSARNARLSSSYDANKGSNTISTIFRERQNRPPLHGSLTSSSLRMTPSNGTYSTTSPRRSTFDIHASYTGGGSSGPARSQSSGRLNPHLSSSISSHHALYTADNTPTQSALATRSQSFVGTSTGSSSSTRGRNGSNVSMHAHEIVHEVARDEHGRTRAPSITRTDLARVASDRSIGSANGNGSGSRLAAGAESSQHSSSSTLQRVPSHLRRSSMLGAHDDDSGLPPTSPEMYPVQYGDETGQAQNGSHVRPLLNAARSKSRSSFTWDHLPSYVPQYTALDLGRANMNRNKSGTSLHSVVEDEAEHVHATDSQHSTIRPLPPVSARKRLFYFPEAEDA